MNRFFNPENRFWNFVAKLADVTCMSFLWTLVSLPLVTAGPATTAFYAFTMHLVSDTEGGVWRSFFRELKAHFKKALLLWLLELLGLAFFAADLWGAWNFLLADGGVAGILVLGGCGCLALIFFSCFLYVYPMLAVFDFPMKKLLRDSFVMAMGNLYVTVTLFILIALACVAFYFASGLFFLWVGLYIFISSYFITGVFWKYAEGPEKEEEGKELPEDVD